jgi:hypothetical protein
MGGCSSSTPKVWSCYPHDTEGKKVSAFYNATRSVYERAGFTYIRSRGSGTA